MMIEPESDDSEEMEGAPGNGMHMDEDDSSEEESEEEDSEEEGGDVVVGGAEHVDCGFGVEAGEDAVVPVAGAGGVEDVGGGVVQR